MLMVAAVLRRRFIGEDLVEGHIVMIDSIAGWTTNDQVVWISQIADQRSHGDVYNIVSKTPAIGPSARNESAILERILNIALQHVAAEDAQARETGVVRITRATASQTGTVRGKIDLDQIRDVN